jgi:2,4-dienoyl-CoA reductase-like NADH-dependent reductase (Old Yellow Enzyme family)
MLFSPFASRDLVLRNRLVMSPMCQYSAPDTGPFIGSANEWHLVHYGSRAAQGVGLILVEATAVEARGRISPNDLGLWQDGQVEGMRRVVAFCHGQGAAIGVQLAHAGRKAGCARPWEGGAQLARDRGGWERVSAGDLPFKEGEEAPRRLDTAELRGIVDAFVASTVRALQAGFDLVEVHAAHGYLLHQFLSPLSNHRDDAYGGSLENRARLLLEVVEAVRAAWPAGKPLFVRLSATDWAAGGWDLPECVALASMLASRGADLVDVSSGGLTPAQQLKPAPGFQVPFAAAIRAGAQMPTGAVGLITGAAQAEAILAEGKADLVFLGRELLRNPGWALRAMRELGGDALAGVTGKADEGIAPQYLRAKREWS